MMNQEQFDALEDFIQAKIEHELANRRGDSINEGLRYIDCREALADVCGLPRKYKK